jgi:fucose 4-O-acetylase-like acetyltransferase
MDKFPAPRTRKLIEKAFNLPSLQESRWKWVDYMKGIAILLVVYRHVLIGIQRSGLVVPDWLVKANMTFYSFRMPLFFILSGLFISGSLAKRTTSRLLYIKFEHLIYPYLVWCFIQVSLQIVMGGSTNSNRGLIDYLYILYQPRKLDQFWYLPALFFATAAFIIVKQRFRPPHWAQLLLGLVFYFSAPFFEKVSIVSDWMDFYFFFALGDALSALFFKPSSQAFLRNYWTLILCTPVFGLAQYYFLHYPTGKIAFLFISLIGCLYMFIIAFRLDNWNVLHFLRVLGYHSLQIYVIHVIVAAFVRVSLTKFLHIHQPVFLLVSGIFFGVTVPIIVYNLFIKDNFAWFLFSPRKTTAVKRPRGETKPPSGQHGQQKIAVK